MLASALSPVEAELKKKALVKSEISWGFNGDLI